MALGSPARRMPAWFKAPLVTSGEGVEWFLVIRIPEVPPGESDAAEARSRLTAWVEGLRHAGFHPMRLSTVLSARERGRRLPLKTVVLLFHPGHRRTYETLAPVLAAQQCPAVWLTDERAVGRSDRRYLSHHAISRMPQSGLWDVAWSQGPAAGGLLAVELAQGRAGAGTSRRMTVNARGDRRALNQMTGRGHLYRLNAHPTWTVQDLVNRLLAEAPVDGPSYLTARRVGSQVWGVALDAKASDHQQPFGLEAPLNARGVSVAWPCTAGTPDLLLHVKMLSRSGEVWVSLRSDRSRGQGIRVGFTEDAVLVRQGHEQATPLAAVPWSRASSAGRLSATVVLRGPYLHLLMDDERVLTLSGLGASAASDGIVELAASDQVRGAAGVELGGLVFVPLASPGSIAPTAWLLQAPGLRSLPNVARGDAHS